MDSIPFRFRRKSFSEDISPLPSPSTSPSMSPFKSSSPLKSPPAIINTKYRPKYSLSPPDSPQSAFISPRIYSPTQSAFKFNNRLPSFKSMFGNLSSNLFLTEDDDIPPSSEFGYNPSECDFSDADPLEDLDSPFDDSDISRRRRLSASSEQEEDAILGLLDLHRRPRLSSSAGSVSSPLSLVATSLPEIEQEVSGCLPTLDDYSLPTREADHNMSRVAECREDYSVGDASLLGNVNCVKKELDDLSHTLMLLQDGDLEPSLATVLEPSFPPVFTVPPPIEPFAAVRSVSPIGGKDRKSESPTTSLPPYSPQSSVNVNLSSPLLPKRDEEVISVTTEGAITSEASPTEASSSSSHLLLSPSRSCSGLPVPSLPELSPPPPLGAQSSSKHLLEVPRDSGLLSDISAQEINDREQEVRKVSSKRRSRRTDIHVNKKAKREPNPGPSSRPPLKHATNTNTSSATSRNRPIDGGTSQRCVSPLSTSSSLSTLSSSSDLDREERHELIGIVIETLSLTRASSMDGDSIWRGVVDARPNLTTKRPKAEWKGLFDQVLNYGASKGFLGTVASSGKDEHNKSLPPRYFYVPEKDPDQERASLLKDIMPRAAGRRSESIKYKQYYWKPLGKWSRWDNEEEI